MNAGSWQPDPTWGPPTIQVTAPTATPGKRKVGVIAAGLIAVAGLGIGGFVLLGDDEPNRTAETAVTAAATAPATVAPTTATPTTVAPTTAVPTTAAPTTAAPTTAAPTTAVPTTATPTLPVATAAQLIEAMPQADDVPASWTLVSDPDPAPQPASGPGTGYCGGNNVVARAQAAGAATAVHGPGFDIDDGSYFGVDAYAFPTVEAAGDFLRATEAQVSGCVTPATYQQPESEFDMLEDGTGDAATWTFVEMPTSTYAVTTEADDLLQVPMDILVSTQADGVDFSLTISNHAWFERHGNIVLVYWLEGYWGFSQGGDPDWAFQPTTEATAAASAVVRTQIVMRLTEMGLL